MLKRAFILFLSGALAVSTLSGCDQTEEGINNGIITGLLAGAGAYFLTSSDSSSGSLTGYAGDAQYPQVVRYDGATGIGLGDTGGGVVPDTGTGGTGVGAGIPGDYLSARFPSLYPLPSTTLAGDEAVRITHFNPMAYNRPMNVNPKDGTLTGATGNSYTVFFGALKNVTGNNGALADPLADDVAEDGQIQYYPGIDFSSITLYIDYYDYQGNMIFSDIWYTGYSAFCYVHESKVQYPTRNLLSDADFQDASNLNRYPETGFYILRPYDEDIYTARIRRVGYSFFDTGWVYFLANFINVEQFNRTVKGKLEPVEGARDLYGESPTLFQDKVRVVATFFDKNNNVVDVQITPQDLEFNKLIDPEHNRAGVAEFQLTSLVDFDRFQLNWVQSIAD